MIRVFGGKDAVTGEHVAVVVEDSAVNRVGRRFHGYVVFISGNDLLFHNHANASIGEFICRPYVQFH